MKNEKTKTNVLPNLKEINSIIGWLQTLSQIECNIREKYTAVERTRGKHK